jgi:formate hydrogenlyase subunit 3/multisubunit Na+/H+ antiporter MnhD subunit
LTASLLVGAVGAPLAAAAAWWFLRGRRAASVLTPIAALPALLLVWVGSSDVVVSVPWLVQHTVLGLDSIGRVFLGFSSVLWLASGWYARAALARDAHELRFHSFFLIAMSGNFGLILAQDVSTFYVCFALMGFASVGLVLHRNDGPAARAGAVYVGTTVAGEALIIAGLAYLVATTGTTLIADLAVAPPATAALVCLLAGFGLKAGALSLHFWLPLAHPAAPVPASAVLSGAMIKAGLLGWIRFLPLGTASLVPIGLVMVAGGVSAALLGTLVGVTQRNPKTVLAYSSISQMGIITVGLGVALVRPDAWPVILPAVLIYATHHALAKGALFLSVPLCRAASGRKQLYTAGIGVLIPALALAGAPFTSGAIAKLALKSNIDFLPGAWPVWLGILLPIAAAGTTLKMLRYLSLLWKSRRAAVADTATGLWAPWSFTIAAVLGGVWLLPGSWELLPTKLSPAKLWTATWPLLAGIALASVPVLARRLMRRKFGMEIPAGDVLVFGEALFARLPGGRAVQSIAATYARALERARRRCSASAARLAESLRAMETGSRDWSVVGRLLVAVVGALSILTFL